MPPSPALPTVPINKKDLNERDICTKFITPAIVTAGWAPLTQLRQEVDFTKGRIIVRGRLVTRGKAKRADYILYYKPNIPIAVIEAKDNHHSPCDGIQQALDYAETLGIPFVFSSNGDAFLFHDRSGHLPLGPASAKETLLALDAFPPPGQLWAAYCRWRNITPDQEPLVLQPYYDFGDSKPPRYYQSKAINTTIEAIAAGQSRVLLVMATGTGKTLTAFQIIWRLWKSGRKKRILFLADRNILVDQTMVNDFRPFGPAMGKLSTASKTIERADGTKTDLPLALDRHRRIDTSYEIYLGLYQAITGPDDSDKLFREFSPTFFDLVVIDECHRGSAADDSAWREILEYFSSATQIGMTATPKETETVSNTDYFGPAVYTYSLREGIRDGFLAPYKVIRVHLDLDVNGFRPELGQTDRDGLQIEDRLYNTRDFDRNLVIDNRTAAVARRITEFLTETRDPFQKTIVFCVDEEHAARMRQALVNENPEQCAANHRYVMRITGTDTEGQAQLGNFIDPESRYPVLVTTSRLLSTGVDAQTCRLIVLDRAVYTVTEFKQILGRGTRVHEDTKKFYFTLMDFRGASTHFARPDFDGPPLDSTDVSPDDPITGGATGGEAATDEDPTTHLLPDEAPIPASPDPDETVVDDGQIPDITFTPEPTPRGKIYVDGVEARIIAERVEYLDEAGRLVTESLRDFGRHALRQQFGSLDDFLHRWTAAERKQAILDELEMPLEPLAEEVGKDLDAFDLICHVAFDQPPLTRRERADNVRKRNVFTKYGPQARQVLEALLQKYQDQGSMNIDDPKVLQIPPFSSMGTPIELVRQFGTRKDFEAAVHDLQSALYNQKAA